MGDRLAERKRLAKLVGGAFLVVYGNPVPQGSKQPGITKTGRRYVRESGAERLRPWRQAVAAAARAVREENDVLRGPVSLSIEFRFAMPASRPKWLKELGSCPRTSTPDLDKLVRAVGDALKAGGLLGDDAQIVKLHEVTKVEIWNDWTGAAIVVTPVPQPKRHPTLAAPPQESLLEVTPT